ncbi:MAG: hypothetical protein ACRDRY_22585 [Pseudonocardiaceae bacterium]
MLTDALHHLIINLDVQDSGQRTNPGQLTLRDVVHDVVRSAFTATGIDLRQPPEDRGDGVLLVLPAAVPKQQMVGRWVEELYQTLRGRNSQLREPVRVRVGIHAGEVHQDDYGFAGTDVNIACRLGSCEPAKGTLRAAPAATAVVAVSDVIYQSVVRHGGPFIDPDSYRQHALHTTELDGPVWLHLPGYSVPPHPKSAPESVSTPSVAAETSHRGIGSVRIKGDGVVVDRSSIGDIMIGSTNRDRRRHER